MNADSWITGNLEEQTEQPCNERTLNGPKTGQGKSRGEHPHFLNEAGPTLYEFAVLFLAYYENGTDDDVTTRTLEHAARAAVAKAQGKPCNRPMTAEMIQQMKEHFLTWTGGFTPESDDEIFTYVEIAMLSGPDPEQARFVLRRWMNEANEEETSPVQPLIVKRRPATHAQ